MRNKSGRARIRKYSLKKFRRLTCSSSSMSSSSSSATSIGRISTLRSSKTTVSLRFRRSELGPVAASSIPDSRSRSEAKNCPNWSDVESSFVSTRFESRYWTRVHWIREIRSYKLSLLMMLFEPLEWSVRMDFLEFWDTDFKINDLTYLMWLPLVDNCYAKKLFLQHFEWIVSAFLLNN